ncbi:hypothetical protein [Butyrivibrio proteoclasticus]|uniref:hypothetical protein n=1 Tax=Butyrivibrio proteoclasticus TaxID=43305 RepID=UPI00047D0802|nr:hypothetical protein [Butyrivibrio proteoclasticus]
MNDDVKMTYSSILRDKDNNKIVRVSFEREGLSGLEVAEGVIPACKIDKQNGYSSEEIKSLENYLSLNHESIFEKAKIISNPLKWL